MVIMNVSKRIPYLLLICALVLHHQAHAAIDEESTQDISLLTGGLIDETARLGDPVTRVICTFQSSQIVGKNEWA